MLLATCQRKGDTAHSALQMACWSGCHSHEAVQAVCAASTAAKVWQTGVSQTEAAHRAVMAGTTALLIWGTHCCVFCEATPAGLDSCAGGQPQGCHSQPACSVLLRAPAQRLPHGPGLLQQLPPAGCRMSVLRRGAGACARGAQMQGSDGRGPQPVQGACRLACWAPEYGKQADKLAWQRLRCASVQSQPGRPPGPLWMPPERPAVPAAHGQRPGLAAGAGRPSGCCCHKRRPAPCQPAARPHPGACVV